MDSKYEVIIVGGGHAGVEASLAASRLGQRVLLVTNLIDRIGAMSCNPAIGGIGKGHLVREIDALGGEMAKCADASNIHSRILNSSRGPAVRAVRSQSDMEKYRQYMHKTIMTAKNLWVIQDDVLKVIAEGGKVNGITTKYHGDILAQTVVITTGTFLGGKLHLGKEVSDGGRAQERPSLGLSESLRVLGFTLGRLKTGTCPRIDGRSINFEVLEEQKPDEPTHKFAMFDDIPSLPQVSCHVTHTNEVTHKIIEDAIKEGDSPAYNGQIDSKGPRYCPSIDEKIVRFKEKSAHLVFLEPHGLGTNEYYPNGLSTSLPPEVQLKFLRSMKGLEKVHITRFGYSVEYDFVDPRQLQPSLETTKISGLFLAGQINGTTGYEEAAAQGLMAGINAALKVKGQKPFILNRDEAYIGVLIDDLITKGTNEPYRMFTSRAEHRLTLRDDNTYFRLMNKHKITGLLSQEKYEKMIAFEEDVQNTSAFLQKAMVDSAKVNHLLEALGSEKLKTKQPVSALLKRPEVNEHNISNILDSCQIACTRDPKLLLRASVELKYEGYIARALEAQKKQKAMENTLIPEHFFETRFGGISTEVHQKLKEHRPKTLGHASRIPGVTPAALSLLAVELMKSQTFNGSSRHEY